MATVTGKWICLSCSWHNHPSIGRCAVCNSARPLDSKAFSQQTAGITPNLRNHEIFPSQPGASGAGMSSDMIIDSSLHCYRPVSVPIIQQREGRGEGSGGGGGAAQMKWVCAVCTYSNWPNSKQCTMCNTVRRHSGQVGEVSGGGGGAGIGDSILDYVPRHLESPGAVGGAGGYEDIRSTTPLSSSHRDSPSNRPTIVKMKKKSHGGGQKKWKCSKCTYENWARAGKCVMCGVAKNKTPSPPISDSETAQSPNQPTKYRHPSSPTENANFTLASLSSTSSSSLHTRSAGINSNQSPSVSPAHSDSSPSAVHLIPCSSSDTSSEVFPPSSLKSTSNEVRQIRNRLSSSDWLFINACLGVVNDDVPAVKTYLRGEGDRARQISRDEYLVLGQPSLFSIGSTLVHLAIKYQRSDILSLLLTPATTDARKRLPSQSNPDLATSVREEAARCLKQHKGQWPCYFFTQFYTFTLPSDIRRFCLPVQKKVLDGVVDREVEKELEEGTPIINWSSELVDEMGCYLYPLWNRTAGDCLLDSVMQATWGVMDRDSTLRRALADSLVDGESLFYKRWKEEEQRHAHLQGYSLGEDQLRNDWATVLALADQKRKSLEQIHVFALAHLLRRPILVYGVKVVKNFRGENLGYVNFEGVYLPLIWESRFCSKSPVALAYTRGHFSALVTLTSSQRNEMGAWSNRSSESHVTHLPLVDSESRQLPLHFISEEEIGCEERLLKQYCDCHVTKAGILTAVQEAGCPHSLVSQLVDEWLDKYRRMDKRREAAACSNYDSDN